MNSGKTKIASISGKRSEGRRRTPGKGRALRVLMIVATAIFLIIATVVVVYKLNVKPPDRSDATRPTRQMKNGPTGNTQLATDEDGDPVADINEKKEGFYTVLLAGTDKGGGLTDVLMVASFDTANKIVNVINIPRDTLVNASDRSIKKINGAYSYGGIEQLQKEVASVIGFVPDGYAVVDLKAFEKLVDTIGGVGFYVPFNMNYSDPTQDLYINLSKGDQWLDGKHALQLVRYRSGYANADLGRISMTQQFLKAVAKQTLKVQNITKATKFADIFVEYVETNLDPGDIIWFAQEGVKVNFDEDVNLYTLSEELGFYEGVSYIVLNEDAVMELVNSTINPYKTDLETEDFDILNRGKTASKPNANTSVPQVTASKAAETSKATPSADAATGEAETGEQIDGEGAADPTEPEDGETPAETGTTDSSEPARAESTTLNTTAPTTGYNPSAWTGDAFNPNGG